MGKLDGIRGIIRTFYLSWRMK